MSMGSAARAIIREFRKWRPFLVVLSLLALGVWYKAEGNLLISEAWWEATVGTKLGEVNRLVREDRPLEAIKALREHIQRDPEDMRLLYRGASLYFEMNRPLPGFMMLTTYYEQARADEVERKSERYSKGIRMWDRLHNESKDQPEDPHVDNLGYYSPGSGLLSRLTDRMNALVLLYNGAPAGWRKEVHPYSVAHILNEPVLSTPLLSGLLDPRIAEKALAVCAWPYRCAKSYANASLIKAVTSGRVEISGAGGECCSMSLDDSDLRPINHVINDYFKSKRRELSKVGETPESLNEWLELNSRLVLKHRFVLNYLYNATRLIKQEQEK